MELRTLRFFVAVAEEQSFTRAAERLSVAQPAVSHQIRSLEKELGEALFERNARSVRLTEAGRVLLPMAGRTLADADRVIAEFASRTALVTGTLLLGAVDGVEHTRLPALLGGFHRQYPGVAVQLVEGRSAELISRVGNGELDAAVVALPEHSLPQGMRSVVMLEDEIVAVVPADSPLAGRKAIPIELLSGKTLISYGQNSGLRPWLQSAFDAAGIDFSTRYATNDGALHVALVEGGVGVSLTVSTDRALVGNPRVSAVPVSPSLAYRKALIWRGTPQPTRSLRALLALGPAAS
ncbi:LysR family transcriptional regulator [Streptomyces sp. 142MFCol3.1]|uniref:LysR family transcriptional regulator n=1 Tax=Streptomyces sp. 142MFCol3.1 TaxID=1172179 RepID=UPI000490754C|nr:LysR family transcriptional regulator [Streptomyces sp. 142MFCol3.1]